MSDPNAIEAPSGCVRRDLAAEPIPGDGIEMVCRSIEVVLASAVAPYGSITVLMRDGEEVILDRLETGWEHVGQYVRILSSSDVDIVRFWL